MNYKRNFQFSTIGKDKTKLTVARRIIEEFRDFTAAQLSTDIQVLFQVKGHRPTKDAAGKEDHAEVAINPENSHNVLNDPVQKS